MPENSPYPEDLKYGYLTPYETQEILMEMQSLPSGNPMPKHMVDAALEAASEAKRVREHPESMQSQRREPMLSRGQDIARQTEESKAISKELAYPIRSKETGEIIGTTGYPDMVGEAYKVGQTSAEMKDKEIEAYKEYEEAQKAQREAEKRWLTAANREADQRVALEPDPSKHRIPFPEDRTGR
tara:strand:+ start:14270 stop:14821 length:552 start_codon:yes stop_codon:yes gene_type:complete